VVDIYNRTNNQVFEAQNTMTTTKVAIVTADGIDVFYRTAGSKDAPVILLLHGFPSSSHMFRNLIPLLAESYFVIAPDLPGYGFTVVPEQRKYTYSFDSLTKTIEAFLDTLSVKKFTSYMFDYGAPVTIRLALSRPESVTSIITQNGNAYEDGFGAEFWAPIRQYWANNTPEMRETITNAALTFEATKWQYVNGSPHPNNIPPEAYYLDDALMARPGNKDIQLALLQDYKTNVQLYPQFHQFLESSKIPVIAIWGKNDPIFIAPGADAFKKNASNPEIHFVDAGHFALETNEPEFARLITDFLKRRIA
jgi:pimeloyl-ACP methyl ester carboxylesterase